MKTNINPLNNRAARSYIAANHQGRARAQYGITWSEIHSDDEELLVYLKLKFG